MIEVRPGLAISEDALSEEFLRASGPGGQNVNKVETAVRLRYDPAHPPALPEAARARLARLAGRRMTNDGVVLIEAGRFRTRERNRADALERLLELLRAAAAPPPPKRKPTRPTRGSVRRNAETKTRRSAVKQLRGRPERD